MHHVPKLNICDFVEEIAKRIKTATYATIIIHVLFKESTRTGILQ